MTLIHTPRVLASIARGLRKSDSTKTLGLTPENPHVYTARVGLFDVDYLGHLNNAAYLNHAEYARWEMTAAIGLLSSMYQTKTDYMVSSASCRYRAQIRPLFRKFEVQSFVGGIDDKSIWIYQNFRLAEDGNNRIRAQCLIKGVTIRNRAVIDPADFLISDVGMDPELVSGLRRPCADTDMENMVSLFEDLETSYRKMASTDDEKLS